MKREKYTRVLDLLEDPTAKFRPRFTEDSLCTMEHVVTNILGMKQEVFEEYDFVAVISDNTGGWDHVMESEVTVYGGLGMPDDRHSQLHYVATIYPRNGG